MTMISASAAATAAAPLPLGSNPEPAAAILAAAGADGKVLKVKALNDYSSDVPIADAKDLDTILAVRMNSKLMSVRDKGPLFMIYPFDTNPELYNEKYFSRSVWQVMEVEVVN